MTGYGDWSEQLSSSGKKYYYNRRTDASSWEKPREWADAERARQEKSRDWISDHDKLKSTPAKLHCDRNNRSSQVTSLRHCLAGQPFLPTVIQDKHGGGDSHRSSPVSSSVSSRHRERQGSRVNNISSNHSESHNNYSRENSQVRASSHCFDLQMFSNFPGYVSLKIKCKGMIRLPNPWPVRLSSRS